MSTGLIFENLVNYSLQIGMLVGVAACIPVVLRLRQPGAKLLYWQILLVVCVLLPLQPWKQVVVTGTAYVPAIMTAVQTVPHQAPMHTVPRSEIALGLLLAGVVIRLGCLAVGFWKLRRYRRQSRPLDPAPTWSVEASVRISDQVASPVTFGWRRPVVLLPANFPSMAVRVQEAILCHEVMHVRRGDWLFTVAEELVRAIFWFHPAIWWLLGEIGLAREQEVDRLAIDITQQREEYMDALLAIAGARAQLDLAPAPLFLRKRHLKHRVVLILKEGHMSKTHLISTLVTGFGTLAAACWLVTGVFPLTAQPVVVTDAPGVSVNLNGATLLHRTGVDYPLAARQKNVQGTLNVEVELDASGNVSDERVLSGPDELRKAVLQSVLQWHFTRELAGSSRSIQIVFELPRQGASNDVEYAQRGVVGGVLGGFISAVPAGASGGVMGGVIGAVPTGAPPPPPPPNAGGFVTQMAPTRISNIQIVGLSDGLRSELLATLPVHEGDEWTPQLMRNVTQAAHAFDEHLTVQRTFTQNASGPQLNLVIATPGARTAGPMFAPAVTTQGFSTTESRIKIAGDVAAAKVVSKVAPVYPALAKSARVSGVVHLAAVIGADGHIQELHSLGGPALLIQAAMDAVKEWVYQPTLLNGAAVAVETTIDVNFTLNQ